MRFALPILLLMLAVPAAAAPSGFGLQLGFSLEEDDIVGGVHYILPISHRFDLAPNVNVGTGGGDGTLNLNGSLRYNLIPDDESGPYLEAGIGSFSAGPSDDTSDIPDAVGPTIGGGVWFNRHGGTAYSVEGRFGFSGLPKVTLQLAVTF